MMNHSKRYRSVGARPGQNSGFTLVELMIATTIFSLVLMLALAGILQITKMYYKAINQTRTQEAARLVIDELSESIKFSKDVYIEGDVVSDLNINPISTDYKGYFCLGSKRYTYAIDRQLKSSDFVSSEKQIPHVLWVDQAVNGCSVDVPDLSNDTLDNGQELLSENMRLTKLEVEQSPLNDDIFNITAHVLYGDSELIRYPEPSDTDQRVVCKTATVGGEFCVFSNISVTVKKRL